MDEQLTSNIPPIEVEATPADTSPFTSPPVAASAGEILEPEKRIRIVLEENDEIPPTGQFIGVNGKGYILRPGEEADVPVSLLESLDHAVKEVPIVDQLNRKVIGWRKRLRFPYRVVTRGSVGTR